MSGFEHADRSRGKDAACEPPASGSAAGLALEDDVERARAGVCQSADAARIRASASAAAGRGDADDAAAAGGALPGVPRFLSAPSLVQCEPEPGDAAALAPGSAGAAHDDDSCSRLGPPAGDDRGDATGVPRFLSGRQTIEREAAPGKPAERIDPSLPRRLDAERGRGRPLEKPLALQMGRFLESDLTGARIHDDAQADALARGLHARAFTTGADIFFRSGRYRPDSADGRELLAHELAHVAQQARGPVPGRPLGAGALSLSEPEDGHEREAKRLGRELATTADGRGQPPAPIRGRAEGIQRQEEEGEEIAAPSESADTHYDLTLSSGVRKGLTRREAIAALREVYHATHLQYDLASGAHRELKKSRDGSVLIGVGGWLTDLVGDDLPALSIWKDTQTHLQSARNAFAASDVEGAAAALSSAYKAYAQAAKTYNDYLAQLESSANWATAGVVVVAVIAVVAAVAVYAVGAGAAATGAGAGATEAAAGSSAVSGTATTVAATEAAAGTGAATAAGAEITSGAVLEVIQTVAANMGNTQALHAYLMQLAASPAGRALLLAAARTAVALSTQPGATQREFQLLKQVSELLFVFARGGR